MNLYYLFYTPALYAPFLAAGTKAGTEYNLFTVPGGQRTDSYTNYTDVSSISATTGEVYVTDANGLPIEIELEDMKNFGFSADAILMHLQATLHRNIIL